MTQGPRRIASGLTRRRPFVYSYWTVRASPDPRLAVGLIGLGNMGTAIAERLLDAGYPLVVNNRTPEKAEALEARGAVVATTPEELVEQVDVVITSLANDEAFEEVAARVIAAARPGTVLVDMSTVSPGASARVASLAEIGVRSLPARTRQRQPERRARREPELHRLRGALDARGRRASAPTRSARPSITSGTESRRGS